LLALPKTPFGNFFEITPLGKPLFKADLDLLLDLLLDLDLEPDFALTNFP
tara:strand:+ start:138 stop:287 length:150 start_codon:yes stop_codon:yes gene_type:complete